MKLYVYIIASLNSFYDRIESSLLYCLNSMSHFLIILYLNRYHLQSQSHFPLRFLYATTRASRNDRTLVSFLAHIILSVCLFELAWALHGGSWLLFQAAAAAAAASPLLKTPLSTAQQATYAAAATYTAVAARAYGAAAAAAQPVAGYAAVAG